MGINANAAKQILKASQTSDKVVMVGHQMRWESVPMQIKEQIDRGELGTNLYSQNRLVPSQRYSRLGTWFTQMDQSGGGPLIDIGVHMLDSCAISDGQSEACIRVWRDLCRIWTEPERDRYMGQAELGRHL